MCVLIIQVDHTDVEGGLLLADALCYVQSFKPGLVDMATLTDVPLGSAVKPGSVVTLIMEVNLIVKSRRIHESVCICSMDCLDVCGPCVDSVEYIGIYVHCV